MTNLALTLLQLYRRYLSPNNLGLKICRFEPSCSKYMAQAIQKHGIIKGGIMGTWRLLRCNPFSKGGYDPVR